MKSIKNAGKLCTSLCKIEMPILLMPSVTHNYIIILRGVCYHGLTVMRFVCGLLHWGDLGVDGWIILGWISRRWDVGIWTGLGWPRIETGGGRL